MSDEAKARMKLLGALMALDGPNTAIYERVSAQVDAEECREAIQTASQGIDLVEGFIRDNQELLAADPHALDNLKGDLVTYYGIRGTQRLLCALQGGSDQVTLLKGAKADNDKALNYPAASYRDPDMRSNLLEIQREIRNQLESTGAASGPSGAASAAKKSGCMTVLMAVSMLGVVFACLIH
jgi:hypothetical protein